MEPKRIILSVTNDLVTDQRVHRSCLALHEAGYEVLLVGRHLPGGVAVNRPYKTHRMRLLFRRKALFYAEYNCRLFLKLLFSRADAFYANDTDTLMANYYAAKLRGKPLFFDAHEMFPEVPELADRPRVKAVWTAIEDSILPHVEHCCTVCQSIADIYRGRYGVEMAVVRNVPLRRSKADAGLSPKVAGILAQVPQGKRIILYQGAVNLGRGIEQLLEAMPLLDECHFIVAGIGDKYDSLRTYAHAHSLDDRVSFVGRLPLEELGQLTHHAQLGLSLLENRGLNYFYSLPNRIADFAQAAVPVLATDFPEIHAVVERYGIGTLIASGRENDAQALAQAIRDALGEWDGIAPEEKQRRFDRAGEELSWQHDKKILLGAVEKLWN